MIYVCFCLDLTNMLTGRSKQLSDYIYALDWPHIMMIQHTNKVTTVIGEGKNSANIVILLLRNDQYNQ